MAAMIVHEELLRLQEEVYANYAKEQERKTAGTDFEYWLKKLPNDGYSYEHWVKHGLDAYGWAASVTQKSGDFGIDVLANQRGLAIGLQCKLYSNAVGVAAVNEAIAGKYHYKCDVVAVMSNAAYTPQAQILAEDAQVRLLSHHDIPKLYHSLRQSL